MLLRVILFTLLCYQAVNAGGSKKKSSIEIDENSEPVKYFWSTVHGVMNAFIKTWNGKLSTDSHPRETIQKIWYALDRTMKDPIGSVSLMSISDHFADTMTDSTAKDTLDSVFTAFHQLAFRRNFAFMKKEFKEFTEGKAAQNISKILGILWDEWELMHQKKLTKPLGTVKDWIDREFPDTSTSSIQQNRPNLKRKDSAKGSELQKALSFARQESKTEQKPTKKPTLEKLKSKREFRRSTSRGGK